MKAYLWPLLQSNIQEAEESHAMPLTMDHEGPGSEPSVSTKNMATYEQLRDEIIELFRMLKSTASGNKHVTDELARDPTLNLLYQCDEMIQAEINEERKRKLREFVQTYPHDCADSGSTFN